MSTIKVKALQGTQCPKEHNARAYILDSEEVDVPESSYYLRLIDDGSLIRVEEPEAKKGK